MPVFNINDEAFPFWSELDLIEIHSLKAKDVINFRSGSEKELLFCCEGVVNLSSETESVRLIADHETRIEKRDQDFRVEAVEDSVLIRVGGNWSKESGNSGVFHLFPSDYPDNSGDPHVHTRNTVMDYHYHDCDEYWIIYKGSGQVITDENVYSVKKGDCIATRAGTHHDMHWVDRELHGVYVETSLTGMKRPGHLWDHTHGPSTDKKF